MALQALGLIRCGFFLDHECGLIGVAGQSLITSAFFCNWMICYRVLASVLYPQNCTSGWYFTFSPLGQQVPSYDKCKLELLPLYTALPMNHVIIWPQLAFIQS